MIIQANPYGLRPRCKKKRPVFLLIDAWVVSVRLCSIKMLLSRLFYLVRCRLLLDSAHVIMHVGQT